jgi:magnesium transporter
MKRYEAVVDNVLALLEERNYPKLRSMLVELNPVDLAEVLSEIPGDRLPIVFRILPKELAAEAFVEMDSDAEEQLIRAFSDRELKEVIDEMFLDDMVDIIEEMPANVATRILKSTDSSTRNLINELLKYPDDSAGSIMTVEYVSLKREMTVLEAFDRIRATGVDKETIYNCYVTDSNRRLIGEVSVKTLLLSDFGAKVGDIMETNVIFVLTDTDKEDVANLFDRYNFLALPVVDHESRLVGIVTVDDAMDVLREESTEDFVKMAAMQPVEDKYLKTSVLVHARHRIVWLLLLMLSATVTGLMITKYEAAFASLPILVSFIPMLMDTGGNCGAQSSTMVIRSMATGEITLKDFVKVLFKEMRISVIVSICLASVNALRVLLMYGFNSDNFYLAVVLGLTLIINIFVAKSLGCILPMLAKKCRLDPAMMASPLITTIVDACSVFIYFNIAIVILRL